jgi:hypothetical protein
MDVMPDMSRDVRAAAVSPTRTFLNQGDPLHAR